MCTQMETQIDSEILQQDASVVAKRALREDGPGDVTSDVVGAAGLTAVGVVEYRSGGVVAGKVYADAVLRRHTRELLENTNPPDDHDDMIERGEEFIRALRA